MFRSALCPPFAPALRLRECHSIRPCTAQSLCRVAGRDCSRQAPSERHVQISLHAAQALLTSRCRRGFTTSNLWLWGRVSDMHFTASHRQRKLITIDKQPNNNVNNLDQSEKAD